MHLNRDSSTIVCAAFLLAACAAAHGGECCLVNEHQSFTPPTADEGDNFGFSLSMSGLRLVVGAPGTTIPSVPLALTNAGMVYIYDLDDELWVEDVPIISSDPNIGDRFGYSVGISGDRVIAGAPFDDPSAVSNAGSAYVYIADSGGWDQEQKLNAFDAASGDRFGYAVAMSGDVAVVGAPQHDHSSLTAAGAVYVFRNNGSGVWSQEQKLVSGGPFNQYWFGASVAIDGNTIIIGEPNNTGFDLSGKAFVYVYSGSTWSLQATLQPTSTTVDNDFGTSVALDGDIAVVGGPKAGGGGARIFTRSGTTWSSAITLNACDTTLGDRYGTSVAISGECAVIGAPRHDNGEFNIGAAYVWRKLGEGWSEIAKLIACDSITGDEFGSAVTFAGGLTAVGAPMKQISTDADQGQSYNYAGFSPCECLGDINESGAVNGTDLALLLGEWTGGSTYSPCPPLNDADLNGDCHVDGVDLALLLGSWGRCPGEEGCESSFMGGSGGEGELTEDQVAALLGFSDASSFYDWIQTADADDVQTAGLTLLELLGG